MQDHPKSYILPSQNTLIFATGHNNTDALFGLWGSLLGGHSDYHGKYDSKSDGKRDSRLSNEQAWNCKGFQVNSIN